MTRGLSQGQTLVSALAQLGRRSAIHIIETSFLNVRYLRQRVECCVDIQDDVLSMDYLKAEKDTKRGITTRKESHVARMGTNSFVA
jgi:hypothetical protein